MIDHVKITVRAGAGGRGIASFRREKFVPKGGPDGGDGGKGGDVVIEATSNLSTLLDLQYKKIFEAKNGEAGGPREMKGADGDNLVIQVPTGSIVKVNRIEYEKVNEKRRNSDKDPRVEYVQKILNYRKMDKDKKHEMYKKSIQTDDDTTLMRENIGNNNEGEEGELFSSDAELETMQTYSSDDQDQVVEDDFLDTDETTTQSHKLYKLSTSDRHTAITQRAQEGEGDSDYTPGALIPTYDLVDQGQRLVIAKGGRGGRGNTRFKSSTHQTPLESERGQKGELLELEITLKMIAQVGLIGYPNAGKSTLLSKLTAATPKIGNYPFTTIEPNLGVLKEDNKTLVIADVPGLIEGAHEGKGLGIQFLQHIERTALLVHMIGLPETVQEFTAAEIAQDLIKSYTTIREELQLYKADLESKPELIVINKIDLLSEDTRVELIKTIEAAFKELQKETIFISAQDDQGINGLKKMLLTHFS